MNILANMQISVFIGLILTIVSGIEPENVTNEETNIIDARKPKVLSRRKRYLTFPEGSSFQLVFCTQNSGFLQLGNIVWFGNTAALAWSLPSDTEDFFKYKEYYELKDVRRNGIIYYTDEDGRVINKQEYHRRMIVNPAFAKRSVDHISENDIFSNISFKSMHEKHEKVNFFENMDPGRIEFHRSGRESLYKKLESFMEGLGWNGKSCVLRMLCESGKVKNRQGTFFDEIIRAVFTLPKSNRSKAEELKYYDVAHSATGDCEDLYPDCQFSE